MSEPPCAEPSPPSIAPQGAARRAADDSGDAGGCMLLVVLVGAAITGAMTLFWTMLWLGALPASLAAAGWQPVPGVLTGATYSPGSCTGKVRGGGPTSPLSLSYGYMWGGKAYTGHLLGPTRWHHFHRTDCGRGVPHELRAGVLPIRKGSPDTPVTVYVNGASPSQAALDKGLPPFGTAGAWLLGFLPLLGLNVHFLRTLPRTPRPPG